MAIDNDILYQIILNEKQIYVKDWLNVPVTDLGYSYFIQLTLGLY